MTVASGFGDVHGQGEVSLTYELPRVKKADEDKPPEPEVAAVVPFAGPLGGGSPVYVVGKELDSRSTRRGRQGGSVQSLKVSLGLEFIQKLLNRDGIGISGVSADKASSRNAPIRVRGD